MNNDNLITLSVTNAVESYKQFLKDSCSIHIKSYEDRLKSNPEGAHVEAVCYLTLKRNDIKINKLEDSSAGGPDFFCSSTSGDLIVEATVLQKDAVTEHSGFPDGVAEKTFGFNDIVELVRTKVSSKAGQVANHSCPRIVFIGTEHSGSDILLVRHTAVEDIFTSRTKNICSDRNAKSSCYHYNRSC